MPSKGRDLKMMEIQFDTFKSENPETKDLKLYRTFRRNPLEFWNWYDYLTNNNYSYEFKSSFVVIPTHKPLKILN